MAIFTPIYDLHTAVTVIAGLLALYCFSGVIYRLQFHPLANIPGPKLAAATLWYEFFYDCILFGQYTFKIGELHEKYGISVVRQDPMAFQTDIREGPLVRISPNELHCNDPDFIGVL